MKTTQAVSVREVENSETLPKIYPITYPAFSAIVAGLCGL
jgi:hypothetical protein